MHLSSSILSACLTLLVTLIALSQPAAEGEEPTPRPTFVNQHSDLNQDNVVDAEDLLILMQDWGKVTGPSPLIEMVTLPAGSFLMGNSGSERDVQYSWNLATEQPRHQVNIAYSLQMGRFEVTNAQYAEVLNWAKERGFLRNSTGGTYNGGNVYHNGRFLFATTTQFTDISHPEGRFLSITRSGQPMADHPVNVITWYGAVAFCNWLSEKEGRSPAYDLSEWTLINDQGGGYRLPSEAEWEFACRGSAANANRYNLFSFGGDTNTNLNSCNFSAILNPYMVWCGNYNGWSNPVGSKLPNDYGLYDMHGNVWEWCEDDWHDNYNGAPKDGSAWTIDGSGARVARGGAWSYFSRSCRSADRVAYTPNVGTRGVGFRVVRSSSP